MRWLPNAAVGFIADLMGVNAEKAFHLIVFPLLMITVFIVKALELSNSNKLVYLLIILLNPYLTRTYIAVPFLIDHYFFYLCLVSICVGVVSGKTSYIIIASALAPWFRQTAVLIIPALIFLRLLYPNKTGRYITLVYGFLFPSALILFSSFINIEASSLIFNATLHSTAAHLMGVDVWFDDSLVAEKVEFIMRVSGYLATISPLLLFKPTNRTLLVMAGIFLIFLVQPIIAGPQISNSGLQRLVSFFTPFAAMVVLGRSTKKLIIIFVSALTFIASLHHEYSLAGFIGETKIDYAVLLICCTLSLFPVFFFCKAHQN